MQKKKVVSFFLGLRGFGELAVSSKRRPAVLRKKAAVVSGPLRE